MKSKIIVVINPKAGTKRKKNHQQQIISYLNQKAELECVYWESANEDITSKVQIKLSESNYSYVVVIGGDGTVNRIARALIGRKEALVIIPVGSGNGLARHLHIPMNPLKAAELLWQGKVVSIDAVKFSDEYFFCTAGVGFDAHVAHLFAKAKKRGFFTYFKAVISSFFTYKPNEYTISFDNQKIQLSAFFITIANANQWGNNVFVAPNADISDGKLNLVSLLSFSWYHLPFLLYFLLSKKFHQSKKVYTIDSVSFQIESAEGIMEGHYDGEPVIYPSKLIFENIHQAINVVVPGKIVR